MLQFQDISDATIANGIDQSSSIDKIPEGFCEDIVNCDISGTSLTKRTGFEKFAGDVPLRVESIEFTNNGSTDSAVFNLPAYVNLASVTAGPLLIQGSFLNESGVKTSLDMRIPTYTKADAFTLLSTDTTLSLAPASSGLTSVDALIGLQDYINPSVFMVDELWVDPVTLGVEIKYSIAADLASYIYSYTPPAGYGFRSTGTDINGTTSLTINGATHSLPNDRLIPMCFYEDSGYYKTWMPDSIEIQSNADLVLTFTNPGEAFTVNTFIVSAPLANRVAGLVDALNPCTVVNIPNAESKHIFVAFYRVTDDLYGYRQLLLPESITYDATTNSHNVTVCKSNTSFGYECYYVYGLNVTNRIIIPDIGAKVTSSFNTTNCSVCVSGISQEELPVKSKVNYLDSYLQSDESLIAVDGQMYRSKAVNISEVFDGTNIALLTQTIGPKFKAVVPGVGYRNTMGFIVTSSATPTGYVPVQSVAYQPSSGYTRYTLYVPSHQGYDTDLIPGSSEYFIYSTYLAADGYDKLTITRCNNSRFNGTFQVARTYVIDANHLAIDVVNPNVNKAIWDTQDINALAGIFTDKLNMATFGSSGYRLIADVGASIELSNTLTVSVDKIFYPPETHTLALANVTELVTLPRNLRVGADLSAASLNVVTSNLVIGDIVQVGNRTTRVSNITSTAITLRDAVEVVNGRVEVVIPHRWELLLPYVLGVDIVDRSEILKSAPSKGSLFLSDGTKYDGSGIYRIGFPAVQPNLFVQVEVGSGIDARIAQDEVTSISTTRVELSTHENAGNYPVGTKVLKKYVNGGHTYILSNTPFEVQNTNSTTGIVTVDGDFGSIIGATYISKYTTVDYFLRLSTLDRNGNTVVSNSAGSGDIRVRLTDPSTVHIRGSILGITSENIDVTNTNLEIFRSWEGGNYRRVGIIPLSNMEGPYFTYSDTVTFDSTSEKDIDQIPDTLSGIGETRSGPLSAKVATTINNQLVLANLTGESKVRLTLTGNTSSSDLVNSVWSLNVGGATTSFKVLNSPITPVSFTTTLGTSFEVEVATGSIANGDNLYIFRNTSSLADVSATLLGWWKVTGISTGTPNDTVTVAWIGAPAALTTADTYDLQILADSVYIPLASDRAYFNCGQALFKPNESIPDRFPYHLASAINWKLMSSGVYARAGRDKSRGFLEIAGENLVSVTMPDPIPTDMVIFANGSMVTAGQVVAPVRYNFGSRAILSLPGYPEIFEDIEAAQSNLPLLHDFNPDDGEDVIASIPFFSESAFGASQRSNALVVFKPHSIFLLDPQAKLAGSSDVVKQIDSKGLGCESAASIATTSDGIFFANKAGIYLLDRSLNVIKVGDKVSTFWDSSLLDRLNISNACACNNKLDGKYYLSIPTQGETAHTSGVLVYDAPDNSSQGLGGWTRYTGICATMWANRGTDTLFATDQGYVGKLRRDGNSMDYSDAGSEIDVSITFRAQSFGLPATRKVLKSVTAQLSSDSDRNAGDVSMSMSMDLNVAFTTLDPYKLTGTVNNLVTGIGDLTRRKIDDVAFSPNVSHATWYQCKLENGTGGLEKGLTIHNLVYTVASLRTRGVKQAAQTTRTDTSGNI